MPIIRFSRSVAPTRTRKAKYHADASYREKAKYFSRRSYRRKMQVELSNCLYSLDFIADAGTVENVRLPNGKVRELHIFYISETAKMLQKRYQTVWRWIDNKMLPPPVITASLNAGRSYEVYHIEEVKIFIEEIGKHEKKVAYFRRDHHDVTMRIAQRIADLRKALFK